MKTKIYLMIFVSLMMIAFASANLGTFKQGECVDVKTILNTSSVTLSTLSYPNGTIAVSAQPMTNVAGLTYNYTFCNTNPLGTYTYDYYDADANVYVNDFDVTPSGNFGTTNIVFFMFIILFIYAINLFGFFSKNEIMTILGGMALIFLGVYMINNGVIIYRDTITNYLAYITIAWGAISSIWAGLSLIDVL